MPAPCSELILRPNIGVCQGHFDCSFGPQSAGWIRRSLAVGRDNGGGVDSCIFSVVGYPIDPNVIVPLEFHSMTLGENKDPEHLATALLTLGPCTRCYSPRLLRYEILPRVATKAVRIYRQPKHPNLTPELPHRLSAWLVAQSDVWPISFGNPIVRSAFDRRIRNSSRRSDP